MPAGRGLLCARKKNHWGVVPPKLRRSAAKKVTPRPAEKAFRHFLSGAGTSLKRDRDKFSGTGKNRPFAPKAEAARLGSELISTVIR